MWVCVGGVCLALAQYTWTPAILLANPAPPSPPPPQAVVQVATFAVNYVGHPFNSSLLENKGLVTSLRMSTMFLAVLMLQLMPDLNEGFQMVPLPGNMGQQLALLSVGLVALAGGWENMLRSMLLPKAPPAKGYMEHMGELRQLQARAKKSQ
jgi:cation-transporting ATPase 13A1